MTLYAITHRKIVSQHEKASREALVALAHRCAETGVDYLQLREKDLEAAEQVSLARQLHSVLVGSRTKLLINSRLDVATAVAADGVHLTSHPGELTPFQVRKVLPHAIVSVSCHTLEDISRATGADLVLFGPVFEKSVTGEHIAAGTGLDLLHEACLAAGETPVLALGGVTPENTAACLQAGAKGIAGIRLFL
ncbi:thiamine phosphate synthase [Terriglobus tenax]|uniref:thiamine phosphate synthase n=1 Tax=Terriglobus tenax TaxID=1111115 RepID=UPI0021E0D83C|nr:thiamine phosphate synthase [Terriglobus tenax]